MFANASFDPCAVSCRSLYATGNSCCQPAELSPPKGMPVFSRDLDLYLSKTGITLVPVYEDQGATLPSARIFRITEKDGSRPVLDTVIALPMRWRNPDPTDFCSKVVILPRRTWSPLPVEATETHWNMSRRCFHAFPSTLINRAPMRRNEPLRQPSDVRTS